MRGVNIWLLDHQFLLTLDVADLWPHTPEIELLPRKSTFLRAECPLRTKESYVDGIPQFPGVVVRGTERDEPARQRTAQAARGGRQNPGRAAQVPDGRKRHQGRDRAVFGPRRPAA